MHALNDQEQNNIKKWSIHLAPTKRSKNYNQEGSVFSHETDGDLTMHGNS